MTDRDNQRIQVFDPNGKFLDQWKNVGGVSTLYMTAIDQLLWAGGVLRNLDGTVVAKASRRSRGPRDYRRARWERIHSPARRSRAEVRAFPVRHQELVSSSSRRISSLSTIVKTSANAALGVPRSYATSSAFSGQLLELPSTYCRQSA